MNSSAARRVTSRSRRAPAPDSASAAFIASDVLVRIGFSEKSGPANDTMTAICKNMRGSLAGMLEGMLMA
eukprot:1147499-Pelagomonas_calceolata.AAC.2